MTWTDEKARLSQQVQLVRLMTNNLCEDSDVAIRNGFRVWPEHNPSRTALVDRIRVLRAELMRLSKYMEGYDQYNDQ